MSQGQYAYTISGIVPQDVYAMADELLKSCNNSRASASVRSDYYHSTPNLRIDINRDRAATYGVSTSAIQSLMRNAYSQNYIYLIKQPDDRVPRSFLKLKTKSARILATWTISTSAATPAAISARADRVGEPSPRPQVTWQASFRFVL